MFGPNLLCKCLDRISFIFLFFKKFMSFFLHHNSLCGLFFTLRGLQVPILSLNRVYKTDVTTPDFAKLGSRRSKFLFVLCAFRGISVSSFFPGITLASVICDEAKIFKTPRTSLAAH